MTDILFDKTTIGHLLMARVIMFAGKWTEKEKEIQKTVLQISFGKLLDGCGIMLSWQLNSVCIYICHEYGSNVKSHSHCSSYE